MQTSNSLYYTILFQIRRIYSTYLSEKSSFTKDSLIFPSKKRRKKKEKKWEDRFINDSEQMISFLLSSVGIVPLTFGVFQEPFVKITRAWLRLFSSYTYVSCHSYVHTSICGVQPRRQEWLPCTIFSLRSIPSFFFIPSSSNLLVRICKKKGEGINCSSWKM